MANAFFDPEHRAARVRDLFRTVARRYDLMNDLQSFGLHRYWKRQVVRLAQPQVGERALDLCCGTGDLALALSRKSLSVIGLDFSLAMLDIAQARSAGMDRARPLPPNGRKALFLCADAQQLPFPDESFEIVTVGYGLRNLANWQRGLAEMARVAVRGGRLLVLDFGKPENALLRMVYFAYLRIFVPILGLLFCRNAAAYAYILESLRHYPAQQGVAEGMRALGLGQVAITRFLGGIMTINHAVKT